MKFTKKAFRAALKANDQTKVWYLTAIKFGRTPTRKEVHDLIEEVADTISDIRKAYDFSYNSERKRILEIKMRKAEYDNQRISHHIPKYWRGNVDYRMDALEILRRLLTEKPSNYTKVPMMGNNHLYFCSPAYGHKDYNKVMTCRIEGNEVFCNKVIEIGERFLARKSA